jgi:hypothetical protein
MLPFADRPSTPLLHNRAEMHVRSEVSLDPLTGAQFDAFASTIRNAITWSGGSTCSHCWFWLICCGLWCGCRGNGSVIGARTAWCCTRAWKPIPSGTSKASKRKPNDVPRTRFGSRRLSANPLDTFLHPWISAGSRPDHLLRVLRFAVRRSITFPASSNSNEADRGPYRRIATSAPSTGGCRRTHRSRTAHPRLDGFCRAGSGAMYGGLDFLSVLDGGASGRGRSCMS